MLPLPYSFPWEKGWKAHRFVCFFVERGLEFGWEWGWACAFGSSFAGCWRVVGELVGVRRRRNGIVGIPAGGVEHVGIGVVAI